LVAADLREYEFDDLVFGALPVTRGSDGARIATTVFAYPREDFDLIVGCLWPPVTRTLNAENTS
jgi:hypothetical protein